MLMNEIKLLINKKQEEVNNDPNASEKQKHLASILMPFFDNVDVVIECPKSQVIGVLLFLGYDYKEVYKKYDELMKEINVKYKLINPDHINFNNK